MRQFLDNAGHDVRASADNLFEIYAIPDKSARISEIKTLISVASCFEKKPGSWLHAQELRREIGRLRPQWLRSSSFTTKERKREKQFLKGHLERWDDAKSLKLRPARAFAAYRGDYESGWRTERATQKWLREEFRRGVSKFWLGASSKRHQLLTEVDFGDPEVFWRVDCFMVWFNALVRRTCASRDYADWLDPYVREDSFGDPSYPEFWLEEVAAENVPRNRLTGLVAYYQEHHKITHGNPGDQLHANNLLDVDVLCTADRAFFDILTKVTARYLGGVARPVLLDRQAPSALGELRAALGGL